MKLSGLLVENDELKALAYKLQSHYLDSDDYDIDDVVIDKQDDEQLDISFTISVQTAKSWENVTFSITLGSSMFAGAHISNTFNDLDDQVDAELDAVISATNDMIDRVMDEAESPDEDAAKILSLESP